MKIDQQAKPKKIKEQQLLFSEERFLPENLPTVASLKPSYNLSAVFDDCHNYIYANEGFLKDKIFHEIIKLLVMKLFDERSGENHVLFGITSSEYRDVLTGCPTSFEQRLHRLFLTVKSHYSDFFSDDNLKLPTQTLAYVVTRLQEISLSKTPGDIKGEAFQAFTYRHQRGGRGEFFTPYPIVKLAVKMLAPQPNEKIIDPACGSGGFLIQAISYLQTHFPQISKAEYIQHFVNGIEFNPDVALSASMRLVFEGGEGTEIVCANALGEKKEMDGLFDVILTNPPFGSKGKVEDRKILKPYLLARKWNHGKSKEWEPTQTLLSGQAPDILFIEKCLMLLKPGGRMAIVLPDGLLQNISNSHIRFWMRQQAQLLAVVSLPQETFIPYGTGVKTSLLILQKRPAVLTNGCFMARMRKIGYDVKGQPIHQRDESGRLVRTKSGHFMIDDDVEEIASAYQEFIAGNLNRLSEDIFTVCDAKLQSRQDVEYYLPSDQTLLANLQMQGAKPLNEIADILTDSDSFRLETSDEIRYIAISDVDARTMQVVTQQAIKPHEAPSRATYRLRSNDIITAISGASTGTAKQATALITEDEAGAICSNGFAVIRNIRGVDPFYLLAFLRTEYCLRQIKRLMTGHAIPAISLDDFSRILVPTPSQEGQEKIKQSVATLQIMRRKALKAGEHLISETAEIIQQAIRVKV